METFNEPAVAGVRAIDGTEFRVNSQRTLEEAKRQCSEYEMKSACIVKARLNDVLIDRCNKFQSEAKSENGEIEMPSPCFYINEDLCRMFGYYDFHSYIFTPKSDTDVENLRLWMSLSTNNATIWVRDKNNRGYIENCKLDYSQTYFLLFDSENECAMMFTAEGARLYLEDMLTDAVEKSRVFSNPEKYIWTKDADGRRRFREKWD